MGCLLFLNERAVYKGRFSKPCRESPFRGKPKNRCMDSLESRGATSPPSAGEDVRQDVGLSVTGFADAAGKACPVRRPPLCRCLKDIGLLPTITGKSASCRTHQSIDSAIRARLRPMASGVPRLLINPRPAGRSMRRLVQCKRSRQPVVAIYNNSRMTLIISSRLRTSYVGL